MSFPSMASRWYRQVIPAIGLAVVAGTFANQIGIPLRLENLIAQGGNYTAYLSALNRAYVRMNLTVGGIADMLGIAYGYLIAQGEISAASVWAKNAKRYALTNIALA